jgi:hypothetical protein
LAIDHGDWDAITARRNVRVAQADPSARPTWINVGRGGVLSSRNSQPWDFVAITERAVSSGEGVAGSAVTGSAATVGW